MSKRVLNIIGSAYRATLEEQDDTIVWLTHAMKGAGAELDVVLRGNAVCYAVAGQDASGLAFGDWRQTQPPRIEQDVAKLASKGVRVFIVDEDLVERGIARAELIAGVEPVTRAGLATLLTTYDQVWSW
jgi:sulfur relay (sulfurtransferase) DsrF/TusC family protein